MVCGRSTLPLDCGEEPEVGGEIGPGLTMSGMSTGMV